MNAAELNSFLAVALVLRRSNVSFNKKDLLRLCLGHPDFPTLLSVSDLLKKFGLKVAVRRLDINALDSWTTFPALLFFNAEGGKLMLLEALDDTYVHLTDTVTGKVRMGREYFAGNWGGLVFDLQNDAERPQKAISWTKRQVPWVVGLCAALFGFAVLGVRDFRLTDLQALALFTIPVTTGVALAKLGERRHVTEAYQALGVLPDGTPPGTVRNSDSRRAIARTIVKFKYDPSLLKAILQQKRTMAPLFKHMHVYSLGRASAHRLTVVADPRYNGIGRLIKELMLISEIFGDLEIQLVFCYVAPFPEYLKALDLFEKFPDQDLARSGPGLLRENFNHIEVDTWTDQQRQLIRNHHNWGALSGVRSRLQMFFNDRSLPDYYQTDDLLYVIRKLKTVQ